MSQSRASAGTKSPPPNSMSTHPTAAIVPIKTGEVPRPLAKVPIPVTAITRPKISSMVQPLLPKIVKPYLLVQELFFAGKPGRNIAEQQVQQRLALALWMHQNRLAADLDRFRGIQNGLAKIGNLINQVHAKGLLSGPHPAVRNWLNIINFGVASLGHCAHELAVHVVNQALHILPLRGRKLSGGVAGVLELTDFQDFWLQLSPAHQVAVVDPLGKHANRSDYATVVGIDFISRGRNVIGAAGPNRLDRGNDVLLLFVTDALDLAVNLLRCGDSAPRGIHVDDDGLDGIIISKFAQLLDGFARVSDHALQVHNSDLVAKSVNSGLLAARMQRDINQAEHGQYKEEESSSSDQNPKPDARAFVFSHKSF